MSRVRSFTLGDHFTSFVNELLQSGRYGNASEVIRDALRMMESREQRVDNVRRMVCDGLNSPVSKNSVEAIFEKAKKDINV
ncbi:type II toxin-antitoxin system ParD family antitoxin [Providencia heimbachae]|uniref:type II toxin-antitoxin system ParD family antitoxin n=1 Tax=Providencia heimbachae TaxID=333962 RepID=UPI0022409AC9|nr:type II toxin-antitoxin system ParD family antitoxin [Providencia heimbachae]